METIRLIAVNMIFTLESTRNAAVIPSYGHLKKNRHLEEAKNQTCSTKYCCYVQLYFLIAFSSGNGKNYQIDHDMLRLGFSTAPSCYSSHVGCR